VPPAREGRTRVAAPWTPDRSLAADWHEYDDAARRACLPSAWAALDCVGAWAGDLTERWLVLGRMTAVVDDLPVLGEPHVVVGEWRGTEGRRTYTASTLEDSDGRIVGRAEHTWVAVDPARFN
jgi:predicted amidohydrolase